ncbi:MAG: hypothetical protein ACK5PZ_17850 [Pirellula sp.]
MGRYARAHDPMLRGARTHADLEHATAIEPNHHAEAINYRMLDRDLWT